MAPMKPRTKATISRLVDNIINRKSETKFVSTKTQDNVPHNGGITFPDVARICPRIGQGEQEWERLGDSIRPSSLVVRGVISMNRNYAPDNRVLLCRVFILSAKNVKCFTDFTSGNIPLTRLLRVNDEFGTQAQAYSGAPLDPTYDVNKELFNVHMDRTYRIAPSAQPGEGAKGVEENPASCAVFTKVIPTPKVLKYDDAKGTDPTNFAPFMVVGYSFADGTGADLVNTRIITNVSSTLMFKDF